MVKLAAVSTEEIQVIQILNWGLRDSKTAPNSSITNFTALSGISLNAFWQFVKSKMRRKKNTIYVSQVLKNLLCNKGLTLITNYKLKEKKDYKLGFASPKNLLCNKGLPTWTNETWCALSGRYSNQCPAFYCTEINNKNTLRERTEWNVINRIQHIAVEM